MARKIRNSLLGTIKSLLQDDADGCAREESNLDEALYRLSEAGVNLVALQSEVLSSPRPNDIGLHPDQLSQLFEAVHKADGTTWLDSFLQNDRQLEQQPDDSSGTGSLRHQSIRQTFPDVPKHKRAAATAEQGLCLSDLDDSSTHQHNLLAALWYVRRWLVIAGQAQQPKQLHDIVSQPHLSQAIHGLLPFVDYLYLAQQQQPQSSLLLSAVPAAVRAWLLADLAMGLLSQDAGSFTDSDAINMDKADRGRYRLPHSPHNCTALLLLLGQLTPTPHHHQQQQQDGLKLTSTASGRCQNQPYCQSRIEGWKSHVERCQDLLKVVVPAPSSSSSSDGALVTSHCKLLLLLQALTDTGSSSSRVTEADVLLSQKVVSSCDVAAQMAEAISSSGDSGSRSSSNSCDSGAVWRNVHLCASCLATALLLDVKQRGSRLGLRSSYLNIQQLKLQSHLVKLLTPLKQAAAAAPTAAAATQLDQEQKAQHSSSVSSSSVGDSSQHSQANGGGYSYWGDCDVLQETRVQAREFVCAVQAAKRAQQQEVMQELKSKLRTLHAVAQKQQQQQLPVDTCSGESVRPACSVATGQHCRSSNSSAGIRQQQQQDQQVIHPPSMADLIGLGNLEQLLLLQIQQQQQTRSPLIASWQQQLQHKIIDLQPRSQITAAQYDDLAVYQGLGVPLTMQLEAAADPQLLPQYWSARTAAAAAADVSSNGVDHADVAGGSISSITPASCHRGRPSAWEQQQLKGLLLQQGRLYYSDASKLVEKCCDMSKLLTELSWAAVEAQLRQPVLAFGALVRSAAAASSSSNAASSLEVLPGLEYVVLTHPLTCTTGGSSSSSVSSKGSKLQRLADLQRDYGPLATWGLASLLVKLKLAGLAEQEQKAISNQRVGCTANLHCPTAAATAAAAAAAADALVSKEVLRDRLLARLDVLGRIHNIMKQSQIWDVEDRILDLLRSSSSGSSRGSKHKSQRMRQHSKILEGLLHETMPQFESFTTADSIVELHLLQMQIMSKVSSVAGGAAAAAVAALQDVCKHHLFDLLVQQLKPLSSTAQHVLAQHLADWNPTTASSSSSSSSKALHGSSSSNLDKPDSSSSSGDYLTQTGVLNGKSSLNYSSSRRASSNSSDGSSSCCPSHLSSCSIGTVSSDTSSSSSDDNKQAVPVSLSRPSVHLPTVMADKLPDLLPALHKLAAAAAADIMAAAAALQKAAAAVIEIADQIHVIQTDVTRLLELPDDKLQAACDNGHCKSVETLPKLFVDEFKPARNSCDAAFDSLQLCIETVEFNENVVKLLQLCQSGLLQQQHDSSSSIDLEVLWHVCALSYTFQQIDSKKFSSIIAPLVKAHVEELAGNAETAIRKAETPSSSSSSKKHKSSTRNFLIEMRDHCCILPRSNAVYAAAATAAAECTQAAAAVGLGMLACIGLWVVPEWGPAAAAATNGEADNSNGSSSSKMHDLDLVASVLSKFDKDDVLSKTVGQLSPHDLGHLACLLDFTRSGSSSSSSSSSSDILGAAAAAAASTGAGNGTSHVTTSSSRSSSSFPSLVQLLCPDLQRRGASGTSAAAAVAAADNDAHTALRLAVWQLLTATKPSVAYALHFPGLPSECKTAEVLHAAVYSRPPQQQPLPRPNTTTRSSSNGCCHCGRPGGFASRYLKLGREHVGGYCIQSEVDSRICAAAACVRRELQQRSEGGPPLVTLASDRKAWCDILKTAAKDFNGTDLLGREFRHLLAAAATEDGACRVQRQQYARALQISLCKSGSTAGLVSRLLFFESMSNPGVYSLLNPALMTAWQQQWDRELGSAAAPAEGGHTVCSSTPAAAGGRGGGGGLPAGWKSAVITTDMRHPSMYHQAQPTPAAAPAAAAAAAAAGNCDPSLSQQNQDWHPEILAILLQPFAAELQQQRRSQLLLDGMPLLAHVASPALQYVERCCLSASCRSALTCWVLCWHCNVEERGGDYTDVKTRAAAAEAASSLVGPDQLQHIRLPAWSNILPAPTPAAAAAAGEDHAAVINSHQRQLPAIWWLSPQITTSSSNSQHSNESWCAALHQAGSPAFEQHCCDHCGTTLDNHSSSNSSDGQAVIVPQSWYCPCCCVAVYCSRACADKDREVHRKHCRVLSNLAKPGGHQKSWDELEMKAARVSVKCQLRCRYNSTGQWLSSM